MPESVWFRIKWQSTTNQKIFNDNLFWGGGNCIKNNQIHIIDNQSWRPFSFPVPSISFGIRIRNRLGPAKKVKCSGTGYARIRIRPTTNREIHSRNYAKLRCKV